VHKTKNKMLKNARND